MQITLFFLFLVLVGCIYVLYRSENVSVFLDNWLVDDYESLCLVIEHFGGVEELLQSMTYSFKPLEREYWIALTKDDK
jgi:hypothetical protein